MIDINGVDSGGRIDKVDLRGVEGGEYTNKLCEVIFCQ